MTTDDEDLARRLGLPERQRTLTPAEYELKRNLRQETDRKRVDRLYREQERLRDRPERGPRPQPKPRRFTVKEERELRRTPEKTFVDQTDFNKKWDLFDEDPNKDLRMRMRYFQKIQNMMDLMPDILDITDVLDQTYQWFTNPNPYDAPIVMDRGAPWTEHSTCNAPPPDDAHILSYSSDFAAGSCISGQSATSRGTPEAFAIPWSHKLMVLADRTPIGDGSVFRYRLWKHWTRPRVNDGNDAPHQGSMQITPAKPGPLVAPQFYSLNPNLLRKLPAPTLPHNSPVPTRSPRYNEDVAPFAPPKPPRNIDVRIPPAPYEREKKVMSKSKKFMVMLFSVLDDISEVSEIVDSFYDALPERTQKRWKCNRNSMADAAGQYGIDNADCKMKALFHNWHAVDPVEAVENIVKNQLEDALIGGIKSKLPPQSNALGGEKELSALLDEIWPDWRNWS